MKSLSFGGMAPKLSEQIPDIDPRFDKLADAILLLHVNNILTEAETNRTRSRLVKQVWREVKR